jgi:hypothetical protein
VALNLRSWAMKEHLNANIMIQRNLNNAFAYDLVPSPSVIIAALKAARRVNDFPTAVRIFEGTLISPQAQPVPSHKELSSRRAIGWDEHD